MIFTILRQWHAEFRRTDHLYMVLVALAVGLLGGLCAVGFRQLIEILQLAAWWQSHDLVELIRSLPWWWKIGVPMLGGLVVGLITHYFAREARGHGVPEVMEAVVLRGGRIRARVVLAKMLASGVCIASGGSVGREGPIVQIGSSLGSTIGRWLRVDERRLRTLVGCGAAAGIAATFNAPIAGALFAVEIILSDFRVAQFSPIVISSVAATVVSRFLLGDVPAFNVPIYSLVSPLELFGYAVLGVLGGGIAVAFVKSLYGAEDIFESLKVYPPLKAMIGGAIIGLIALAFPEVLGVGYETIDKALSGNMVLWLLLVLVAVKILAVSVTIGSGGSGGIFAPSLFIGAMLGGVVGVILNNWWPGAVATPGAYSLVGMAAVVAAATHGPMTAILIVFELTNDYKIILPLMICCIIATIIATRLQSASIYTLKLLRRGVDIKGGKTIDVLADLKVNDVMREEFATVRVDAPLMSVLARMLDHPGNTVFVVDRSDRLVGLVTLDAIQYVVAETQALESVAIAKDVMSEHDFPVFKPYDRLTSVMKRLVGHVHEAPVVRDGRIVGSIWPDDLIDRYNAEIFRREMATGMSNLLAEEPQEASIPGNPKLRLAEIDVPYRHAGKTIAQLGIRKKYGVTILLVRRRKEGQVELIDEVPSADTRLQDGDMLLLMGSRQAIRHFEIGRASHSD